MSQGHPTQEAVLPSERTACKRNQVLTDSLGAPACFEQTTTACLINNLASDNNKCLDQVCILSRTDAKRISSVVAAFLVTYSMIW